MKQEKHKIHRKNDGKLTICEQEMDNMNKK